MEYTRKLERLCAEQELKIALYQQALKMACDDAEEQAYEEPEGFCPCFSEDCCNAGNSRGDCVKQIIKHYLTEAEEALAGLGGR